jgi:hypothetical protein
MELPRKRQKGQANYHIYTLKRWSHKFARRPNEEPIVHFNIGDKVDEFRFGSPMAEHVDDFFV